MLLLLYLVVKTEQYIVTSSCRFLDEKTMLEIWLNPGLNLTIFRGTGPRALDLRDLFLYSGPQVSHRQECFSSSLHKSFLWASDIFSLINSQSWVSTFSTSTTSAMFTSCPNRICPRSSARLLTIFPAFLVREN